jgi:hypothetical protein
LLPIANTAQWSFNTRPWRNKRDTCAARWLTKKTADTASENAQTAKAALAATQNLVAQNERLVRNAEDQSKAMQRQVEIIGIAVEPHLIITDVRAEDLKVGKEPVFIVSIMNDGATDAKGVVLSIQVNMEERGWKTKWRDPQVVTIPARQTQHYFVPWRRTLDEELIDAINTRTTSVKVSGYFKLGEGPQTDFCYIYYPWKGTRPDQISQFIPCDFSPALKSLVGINAFLRPTGDLTAEVIKHADKKDDEGETHR